MHELAGRHIVSRRWSLLRQAEMEKIELCTSQTGSSVLRSVCRVQEASLDEKLRFSTKKQQHNNITQNCLVDGKKISLCDLKGKSCVTSLTICEVHVHLLLQVH